MTFDFSDDQIQFMILSILASVSFGFWQDRSMAASFWFCMSLHLIKFFIGYAIEKWPK